MKLLKRGLIAVALLVVAVYLADYLSVQYRIPNHREPFGKVQVLPYYAVKLKNRKTEFMPGDPEDQVCVNSLFPHFGYTPCWYLNRHKRKEIDVGRRRARLLLAQSRHWVEP